MWIVGRLLTRPDNPHERQGDLGVQLVRTLEDEVVERLADLRAADGGTQCETLRVSQGNAGLKRLYAYFLP